MYIYTYMCMYHFYMYIYVYMYMVFLHWLGNEIRTWTCTLCTVYL